MGWRRNAWGQNLKKQMENFSQHQVRSISVFGDLGYEKELQGDRIQGVWETGGRSERDTPGSRGRASRRE